ncbi:XRE family transcriptional regulator [Pedobacter sp. KBW01]|uniref:helix-turn-helix domain-containing protein n=1 Tax=Pedobacter sp. KBW01 TaxID=2153364 RepID=UPI000F5943C5|nr:helix-turn-helix transcriptional regulator [Pedobacter sp. KBW01]RQO79131.1 XRE family transcriptional regulator [Pedobacter sp. KBW01]
MSKIEFIVEKTDTGFSAYASDDSLPIGTSGDDVNELKTNIVDAYNSYAEIKDLDQITIDDVIITLDVKQFFEYYKIINASALGEKIGMGKTLISQYVNGHKKPGPKQVDRILSGVRQLGQELSTLNLTIS